MRVENQADGVDLAFVIPEEGSNWFVDAMCVLKDAPHKKEAEMWINFIASTEANLANMICCRRPTATEYIIEVIRSSVK